VLTPYGELGLAQVARPAVLRAAEIEHRNHTRLLERKVFAPTPDKSAEYRAEIGQRLAQATFKVNGQDIRWEEATLSQHKARVLWLEAQIMGAQQTRRQHIFAVELLEEYGAERLSDIPNWQNLLAQRVSAQLGQEADGVLSSVATSA